MWTRWLGTFAICALTTGCQLASNAVHNVTYEAQLTTDEVREHCHYEKLANAAWNRTRMTGQCQAFPKDYAKGFKDGFVDYLQFGGSGQPPYVPPKHYWGPRYRTPAGYQAIEDWYAGFRHGAATAQQSGYRQFVRLPSAHTTEPMEEMPAPGENWSRSPRVQRSAPCLCELGAPIDSSTSSASNTLPRPIPAVTDYEVEQIEYRFPRRLPTGTTEAAIPTVPFELTTVPASPGQVLDFTTDPAPLATFGRPSVLDRKVTD